MPINDLESRAEAYISAGISSIGMNELPKPLSRGDEYLLALISNIHETESTINLLSLDIRGLDIGMILDGFEVVSDGLPKPLSRGDKYLLALISNIKEMEIVLKMLDVDLRDSTNDKFLDNLGGTMQSTIY